MSDIISYNIDEETISKIGLIITNKQINAQSTPNARVFEYPYLENVFIMLIEKIKNIIVEMIHYSEEPPVLNFSAYLSEKLNYDYNYLSNLFSEVKGTTIEHFIIAHKIEKAKELLIYNELTLTEIAEKLHYSNVAHLSNQFKKVTGLTPSFFKKMKHKRLIALENLWARLLS